MTDAEKSFVGQEVYPRPTGIFWGSITSQAIDVTWYRCFKHFLKSRSNVLQTKPIKAIQQEAPLVKARVQAWAGPGTLAVAFQGDSWQAWKNLRNLKTSALGAKIQ